jgi:hypothetical protein
MNSCNCKHAELCNLDAKKCKLVDDPWCKPDRQIFGMSTKEICNKQGRKGDLK